MSEFVEIGFLQKSYGTKGEIRSKIDMDLHELPKFIFLHLDGSYVPFCIEHVDDAKALIKLEWLNNPEAVDKLTPTKVFLEREDLVNALDKSENILLEALITYAFSNAQNEAVGKILRIDQYPGQLMLVIERSEEELLIPFHEDLLIEIDHFAKVVVYDLPEGILLINN